ncbi:MAG: hypothetical protein DRG76_06995 [Deltaproteobacteria bacterium]|nr:MAG: hypothetical protein DRG76_06995 [Deltaproteobacteria bacterium]
MYRLSAIGCLLCRIFLEEEVYILFGGGVVIHKSKGALYPIFEENRVKSTRMEGNRISKHQNKQLD